MKVLFINPPGPTKGIHNGIGLLSAVLSKKAGMESFVLDMNNSDLNRQMVGEISTREKSDFGLIKKEIETGNPDFVCLPVLSLLASDVAELVRFVKSEFPDKKVVVGGPHLSFEGEAFLEESGADFGIVGEGETPIVELVEGKKAPLEIGGLIYKQRNGKIAKTGPGEPEKNLDSLPFPDYGNFSSVIKNDGKITDYPLTTSRGCPYMCVFCCSHIITGRTWRARSPENVVAELVQAKQKYGIRSVAILDDNFTLERDRAFRICELVVEKKLDLKMRCLSGVRADKLDMELLKKMKEAGFSHLSVGIESVNPVVFKAVKKGETLDAIKGAIENAKNVGIKINGFFVIGLPYSTYERDLESIRFAKSMGITCWWSMATPFPHTELWDWVNENGRWLRDFRNAAPSGIEEVVFDTPDYPADKRKEAFRKALIAARNFDRLEKGYVKRFQACLMHDPAAIAGYHYWLARRMAGAALRHAGIRK